MSASADIQSLLATRLALRAETVLGDGVATEFTIAHGLTMHAPPAVVIRETVGGDVLVEGTDYDLEQVDEDTLTVTAIGGAPAAGAWTAAVGCLRVVVPIVARRQKELAAEIEAAAANHGLCIYVMPPLPTRAMQGVPFVFFEAAEIRIRIIEQPPKNGTGADAYDLVDDVAAALHWHMDPIFAHPLELAARPTDAVEDPRTRIIDVIFNAIYGFKPAGQ